MMLSYTDCETGCVSPGASAGSIFRDEEGSTKLASFVSAALGSEVIGYGACFRGADEWEGRPRIDED